MTDKYFYLVASLPYQRFDERPPLSREIFLKECQKWLSEMDFKAVSGLDTREPDIKDSDIPLVLKWKAFDMYLRAEIAKVRGEEVHTGHKAIPDFVRNIMEKEDPLLREKAIDKIRWTFAEGEEHKYLFDVNRLILYFIKLQILERLAGFEFEKGKRIFDNLCEVKDEQKNW